MSSINRVMLMGRLGADPEVRRMNSGDPIVNLRLATSEVWRDKDSGERKERTQWHTVVVFNDRLAKLAEQYLKKGHLVYVEGMLATRKRQDQNGQDRWSTEVVLQKFNGEIKLLPQGNGGGQGASSPDDYGSTGDGGSRGGATSPGLQDSFDDEIPF